jgi:hypothetical protein
VAHGVEGSGGGSDVAGFFGFDEDEAVLERGHGETRERRLGMGLGRWLMRWLMRCPLGQRILRRIVGLNGWVECWLL